LLIEAGVLVIQTLFQDVFRDIDANREPLIGLCAKLVAAPSVNPPGDTRRVADIVQEYLAGAGVGTDILVVDAAAPNVIGIVNGHGPGKHVIFNAHMDTMEPGQESDWTVPIFELTRKEGRLYGLGLGNMKGALAAMCLVTVLLARRRDAWSGRLTMTAVSDEVMFGDRGSAALLRDRGDLLGNALISGEGPGYMALAVAEKGLMWLDIESSAPGGHASRAVREGTAISALAALLTRLDALNDVYAKVPADLHGLDAGKDQVGLRVSFNIGKIAGGTLRGQIARSAKAEVDVRLPPGMNIEELLERARQIAAPFPDATITLIKGWNANWTGLTDEVTRVVSAASAAVRGQAPPCVVRLPASDAMRWRALGVPAVCYGPQPTLSAGCDDYVVEQELVDCAKVYAHSALTLFGAAPESGMTPEFATAPQPETASKLPS
jgi:succinyl-diaminopimelate desuccinylase